MMDKQTNKQKHNVPSLKTDAGQFYPLLNYGNHNYDDHFLQVDPQLLFLQ